MIVKNEAPVILRCLDSVRPIITDWLIVDTGSTDGTQDLIRERLADVPGSLHERPWVNFAHNRNEALDLVPQDIDYVFFIDADETLGIPARFRMPALNADEYMLTVRSGSSLYLRKQLIRRALPWRWQGVLHEYMDGPVQPSSGRIPALVTHRYAEGARARDPETYRKDAQILEQAVRDEPENSRYVFYLAQSYRDAAEFERALTWYRRRAEMGGWIEEHWQALYQAALLRESLLHPWPEVMQDYLEAYELHPARAEALYRIGMHYQEARQFRTAYFFLSAAANLPAPSEALFLEGDIYHYHASIEAAVAEYWLGRHDAALTRYRMLLRKPDLPAEIMELIRKNMNFSVSAKAFARKV